MSLDEFIIAMNCATAGHREIVELPIKKASTGTYALLCQECCFSHQFDFCQSAIQRHCCKRSYFKIDET